MTPSTLLLRLIDTAEAVLCKPRVMADVETTRALFEEVTAFAGKPCDGPRFVGDEALMLARVLHLVARERSYGNAAPAQLGCQLAGVILPYIREDLTRAIVARRDGPRPADPATR